jgi:glycosyltransferase involved in cell wall biosynthesis
VLAQTWGNIECIVVDDGSGDRTTEIARSYGDAVRCIRQENAERSAARNTGISISTGEFLSFLDADDILLPGKIQEQVSYLEANPEYDAVYSRVAYFRENKKHSKYTVRRITPTGDIAPFLLQSNFITVNAPLFRREAVKRAGGFDVSLSRYEDWDFLLRLALTGSQFGFIDTVHALCRMHGDNTVKNSIAMFEAKFTVATKLAKAYRNEIRACGCESDGFVALHKADYGRKLILAGRVSEGTKLIDEACKAPFPHCGKFRLFSLAVRLCGHRFLGFVQNTADSLLKYRKARKP